MYKTIGWRIENAYFKTVLLDIKVLLSYNYEKEMCEMKNKPGLFNKPVDILIF